MKKRIIAITAALMMFAAPAMAQIFMTDEDLNNRAEGDPNLYVNLPGVYGSGEDWYAPVGEGLYILTCMVGVYLIQKRIDKEKFLCD